MKKISQIKNTRYDWLINYIPKPIRKGVGGFKDKIVSLFKRNAPKQTVCGRGKKVSKPRKREKGLFYIRKEQRQNKGQNDQRYLETF